MNWHRETDKLSRVSAEARGRWAEEQPQVISSS